jgi:hypothetical protein
MQSGTTHDGLSVLPEYNVTLAFSWPCAVREPDDQGIGMVIEFNTNATGRKFPYIVAWFGKWHVQMGWLWG